ncbi:MAG TPA: hypothetical protein VIJ57_10570 [Hanamia sp.]
MIKRQSLSEEEKIIIRDCYKQTMHCDKILAMLKETNLDLKKHHIWAFASSEGITRKKNYQPKDKHTKEGCFNVKEYYRKVSTI